MLKKIILTGLFILTLALVLIPSRIQALPPDPNNLPPTYCTYAILKISNSTITVYTEPEVTDRDCRLKSAQFFAPFEGSDDDELIAIGVNDRFSFTETTFLSKFEQQALSCIYNASETSIPDVMRSAEWLIERMPSSPDAIRLPTILQRQFGTGTLASELAIMLFNSVWQFLALQVAIGFYKLIPGKMT